MKELNDDAPVAGGDRQFVTALARGLEVLRCFRAAEPMLGNGEIAALTGLPKPTVSRLTHTLTRLGYLVHVERFAKYQLGAAALSIGYTALSGMDIRHAARPLMQELAEYSDVGVSLGSFDETSMIYIESCRGKGAITIRLGVGSRVPVATTAMGRAFLAAIPSSRRDAILAEVRSRHPEEWERTEIGMTKALEEYASKGYTTSVGDWQSGIHAIGTTLTHPNTGEVFALNCGGAAFLLPLDRLESDLAPRLLDLARRVELALGR